MSRMSKGGGSTAMPESNLRHSSESPLETTNTVLKLGGSTLFRGPSHTLCRSVRAVSNERTYVIIGGGETVESMRLLHSVYPQLSEPEMHWRCVDLLDATWQVACELMPECKPLESWPAIQTSLNAPGGQSFLVRVRGFYDREIEHDPSIEENWIPAVGWQTTTDALAWFLAKRIRAQRLRIAKQCTCDTIHSIHDASARGVVDAEISRLVARDPEAESLSIELFSLEGAPS